MQKETACMFQIKTLSEMARGETVIELMIIADDFTGALDSGVHFAEKGIPTRVIVSLDDDRNWEQGLLSDETTVLVVDAETRHASPDQAYRKVYAIVEDGKKAGIPYIYKKTDSALRGNIGSELEAACRAAGEKLLHFVPALPQMNRITQNGKQYIDGVPVSQSVFGTDPFEPVTDDSVKEIIHLQSSIPVMETDAAGQTKDPRQTTVPGQAAGIIVYDVSTDADIKQIGARLAASDQHHLLAGCAGFASILPDLLGLKRQQPEEAILEHKLFVICGSVNPITKKQLDYGQQAGYPRIYMSPEEKLDREFGTSEAGSRLIRQLAKENSRHDCVILDTNDRERMPGTLEYARVRGMDTGQVRQQIPETLGIILKQLMNHGLRAVWLVTGGDTLLGFMKEIRQWELKPIRQIRPGCVLTKLYYHGQEHHIITKSGGFGDESLLLELVNELKERQKGEENGISD